MKNPFLRISRFWTEMAGELRKAAWPSWSELGNSTLVVIVAVLLFGCYTGIVDFSLFQIVSLVTSWIH